MDTLHPAPAAGSAVGEDSDDFTVTLRPVDCVHCPDHPEQDLDLAQPDELDGTRLIGVCHLCPTGHWFGVTFDAGSHTYRNHGRLYHSADSARETAA